MAALGGGVWTLATNGNLIYKIGSANVTIAGLNVEAKAANAEENVIFVVDDTNVTSENIEEYINIVTETDANYSTIELKNAILGDSNVVVTLPKAYNTTKLALDDAALIKIADDSGESSETLTYTASDGKAVVSANLTAGFNATLTSSTNKNGVVTITATHKDARENVILATISGLQKDVGTSEAAATATITDNALDTESDEFDKTGTITLSKDSNGVLTNSVLGTTAITIANSADAKANGINYYLALGNEGDDYSQENNNGSPYWTYSGTTATYKFDSPTGYKLDKDDGTATKVNITAAKTTTVVTVKGLASGLDVGVDEETESKPAIGTTTYSKDEESGEMKPTFVPGLTAELTTYPTYKADGKTINTKGEVSVSIDKNVLTTTNLSIESSTSNKTFTVNTDNILTSEQKLDIWVINGSTATYKRVKRAYYKTTASGLTYTKQADVMTFLTISGLKAEALDEAVKTATTTANISEGSDNYEPALITAIEGLTIDKTGSVEDLKDLYTQKKVSGKLTWVADTSKTAATIKIDPTLLDNKKASIGNSDNFKIQLSESSAPTFDDLEWNLDGTKAILKGDIAEGWIVTQNGKAVNYTKAGENQTLATITGLKTGTKLVVEDAESDDAADDAADDTAEEVRVIGFGNDSSFKQGITISDETLDSNKHVDYSTSTVEGANDNYSRITVTLSKNVLNTSTVAMTSNFFDLSLKSGDTTNTELNVPQASVAAADAQPYWTLGTTTYLKKGKNPYYVLANNQLSVDYKTSAGTVDTLTTIKGLDANVTEADLTIDSSTIKVNPNALDQKDVSITNPTSGIKYTLALNGNVAPTISNQTWDQSTVNGAVTYVASVAGGYKTNSTGSKIVYTPSGEETTLFSITGLRSGLGSLDGGGFSGISLSKADNTVKLSYSALNNANVALKSSYGYDLVIDGDVPTSSTGGGSAWVVSGTDAILKEITTPAYYVYDEAKDTLTYKPAVVQKSGRTETTYARISGLKKGLMMNREGTAIGYYDENGVFVEGITFEGKNIIIRDKGVLSTTDVKLDKVAIDGKYSISFAENLASEIMPQFNSENPELSWTVKNKTAYLLGGVSEGYVLDADGRGIKYYKGNETSATIATISNLAASVTTDIANSVDGGFSVNSDSITAGANVLGNTKLTLKTNIPIDQHNYKFTLVDSVQTYEEAVDSADKIWTINTKTSTATYRGSIESPYYALDENSTTISYTAAGLPTDLQFAKIEGLTNLVTIADGALKGVDTVEGSADGNTLFQLSSGVLKAGTSVKLTDMSDKDGLTFGLSMAEDVDKPKDAAGFKLSGTAGSITLYNGKTAGYVLDGGLSNLNYTPSDTRDENKLAEISGLTTTFKSNGTTAVASELYEEIDGIKVNGKEITLSNSVLPGNAPVKFEANKDNEYTFALDSDVNQYSSDGLGWKANDNGVFDLYSSIKHAGYKLADNNHAISIMAAGGIDAGTKIGSISGIKGTVNDTTFQIAGITFDTVNKTITLSKGVLNSKDVTLTTEGGYTLALNTDEDDSGYVAGSDSTNIWTFNNGTAIYEQKTTEGYDVDSDEESATKGKKIIYSKASTITTKIDNLNKDNVIEVSSDGTKLLFTGGETSATNGDTGEGGETGNGSGSTGTEVEAIIFNSNKFIINKADVLAHKTSSIKVTTTGVANADKASYDYKLDLAAGIAATKLDPVWNKTNKETTAKLTQTTKAGYSLQADGKKVIYSSDPTTATLATVSNLKKDVALDSTGQIDGTSIAGLSVTKQPGSDPGVITIGKGVLDTGTAQLGKNDQYKFALAEDVPKENTTGTADVWSTASANKGKTTTATLKKVKPAFYSLDEDDKKVKYNSAGTGEATFTITGLKSGVKADPDGSLDVITVVNNKNITFTEGVLGTTDITFTPADSTKNYTLKIGDSALDYDDENTPWKDKQEWINSGTTYTYKTYDKASYEIDGSTIKYHAPTAGTTHAVVKGLKSGLDISTLYTLSEGATSPTVGGTLTLSANELNKTNVTLTNYGDTKIELALDNTEETLEATVKAGSWTTNKTKATLTGTVGVGYVLSEDAKTITYNKSKTTKTLATVNGIKSGATIADSDVDDGIITLGKDQLGTSNVTVSGDGYKLALKDTDNLESTSDAPAWIKTEGSTKATYTQTIYNGFKEEDNGKTLKYYKNTTNVNYITINGLKSDLAASDFSSDSDDDNAEVKFDDGTKTITLKASALAKSNVTLATTKDYSDYSLELDTDDATALAVKDISDKALTFNNGTASLLQGKTEGWTRISATKITYIKPVTTTLATITGLPKNLDFTEDLADPSQNAIAGITVSDTAITLDKRVLDLLGNGKSVTLTNGKDSSGNKSTYTLDVDTSDTDNKVKKLTDADKNNGKPELTLSGTTAYLKATTEAGYTVGTSKGNPIITKTAKKFGDTLATITGLPKGCKLIDGNIYLSDGTTELLSYTGQSSSDKQVNVNSYFLSTNSNAINLSITGGTFNSVTGLTGYDNTSSTNFATFSKGTMTYKHKAAAGWTVTSSADSVTGYQYKTEATSNIATVSGLNTAVDSFGTDNGIYADTAKTFAVGSNALTTKNVTITMPKKTKAEDFYQFTFRDDVYSTVNASTEAYWKDQVEWVASGGKAVYKLYDKTHYELVKATSGNGKDKNTTIKYIAPTNVGTQQYATISGLTKVASIGADDVSSAGVISLTADDLGTSKVQLTIANASKITVADDVATLANRTLAGKKDNVGAAVSLASVFKLDFATGDNGVVESKVESAVWETTGTTAKLVGTVTKGYILSTDKKSVTYQSKDQDGKTIAQITGLRNGAEIKAADVKVSADDKRISYVVLDNYDLGTKDIALTGAGYALSLGSDVIDYADTDAWSLQSDWVASNGTFTYKEGYNKASWKKVSDTSIKYYAAKGGTDKDRVAITGLNKDIITAQVDSLIAGAEDAGAIVSIGAGNVITLGEKALNRANIAMSKNLDGYTFANVDDTIKSKASDLTGTVSDTTVTVKATQSQGYLLTNNSQGFTYYANETTPNIAVISGLISPDYAASLKGNGADANLTFDENNNTFTLKGEQLSSKVGVSGTARFSFDPNYSNASIIGSAGVDNIKVAGTGLSINASNGNDYIDLGTGGNNTFLYAKGQGNDVIANFTPDTDKIKLTNINKSGVSIKKDGDDALITLKVSKTTGSIRVKGLGGTSFKIEAKDGEYPYAPQSSNVLADDNFATTPQLSSIVKGSSGYMVTDDLTADATSLPKTDTTIAYSGDKK